jgi:hypothetical protein
MKVKKLNKGVRPIEEGLQEFGATLNGGQSGKAILKRTESISSVWEHATSADAARLTFCIASALVILVLLPRWPG